jgi:ABC-2 type transport system ATP-binding protein
MKQGRVITLDTTANLMAAHPGGTLEDVFVQAMKQ